MHSYHRFWLVSFIGLLTLVLAACGGGNATPEPTAAPSPIAEQPTRTPRPTLAPRPTATPLPEPTATTVLDSQISLVDIGPLETYRHPSGVFQIDVPNNWTLQDNSSDTELQLVWVDPTGNGAIIVVLAESSRTLSDTELADLLTSYLNDRFGSQPDFSTEDPQPQRDGSQLIVWSYTATADNNVRATLLGNSFVEQRGNKISILTTMIPQEQFEVLSTYTDRIINTYRINESVALSGGTAPGSGNTTSTGSLAPVEIGELRTYTHPSGVFRIDRPVNWTLTDNSRPGELILVWTDPTNNAAIVVDVLEDSTVYSDDQLIEKLVAFLKNSFGDQPDFFYNDPRPQNDGSILIVWGYTSTASNNVQASMLGNSFIEQRGDKVSVLTTLVPEEQFDKLKSKTDEIINTYRLDPNVPVP
ncbi:hypothetical protein [Chloroflexus sp.]|uniref:hypothetical protein n=1 Tax=Chloroflexus sp. TaxID=1904827 RepID=UPI003C769377